MTAFDASNSAIVLIPMAYLLGLRHGFDLDHLATIDAITRTVRDKKFLSGATGFLFSLGHGLVVVIVSLIIGTGIVQSQVPLWLDSLGKAISIFFLFAFGFLNLWNILRNPTEPAMPFGVKSFLTRKLSSHFSNPFTIMLIGALFALSFDTFSQIALFSLSASVLAGWAFSGVLGMFFTIGMMTSDGLNGLFVSKIIQRADTVSLVFSRSLGLAIALFSLIIGAISLMNLS